MVRFRFYLFLEGMLQKYVVIHPIRRHRVLTCPDIDDVNVDHLIKVVSGRILHYEITVFPFVIDRYLIGSYVETR